MILTLSGLLPLYHSLCTFAVSIITFIMMPPSPSHIPLLFNHVCASDINKEKQGRGKPWLRDHLQPSGTPNLASRELQVSSEPLALQRLVELTTMAIILTLPLPLNNLSF